MSRSLIALSAALAAGGCGPSAPPLAAVDGTVAANGRPLGNVEVVFVPDGGTPGREAAAYTDSAGRYRVPHDPAEGVGVPVGVHRVLVRDADMYLVPPASGIDPESGEAAAADSGAKPGPARKASRVPLAYGDAAKTPLRGVRIQPGSQTFDIAVETK